MAASIGALIIHGMGSQKPNYSKPTSRAINKELQKLNAPSGSVAWQEIWWADVLGTAEHDYLERARQQVSLKWLGLRSFVVNALGDAVGYQQPRSQSNSTYDAVHTRVRECVRTLYVDGLAGKPKPMVVLAHSLGGQVMSNYIWDRQKSDAESRGSEFEDMRWLAGLITFGCNIPLFSFAYEDAPPISFPGDCIPEATRTRARWYNFLDADDVLAYPLRAINDNYARAVSADISINVGSPLTSWSPLSHGGYWTDSNFVKPVAKFIHTLI